MLKPDVAKTRIQEWLAEDDQRFLPRVSKLPKKMQSVAYTLLGCDEDGQATEQYGSKWMAQETLASVALDQLSATEMDQLVGVFFSRLKPAVLATWQALPGDTYQSGYTRKAFRASKNLEASRAKRFKWLSEMVGLAIRFKDEALTPTWLAAWALYTEEQYHRKDKEIGRLLAGVMDAKLPEAEEVLSILLECARNEHEIGGFGQHVSAALLSCSNPVGWEMMEKMLLAAQRQEGLRQHILETIDEAHPQAFPRMLRMIVDNNLARFSAVTRALDVWLGFLWDSASVKVVNDSIQLLLNMLNDSAEREKALRGKQAEHAYLALWVAAFEDADAAAALATKQLEHSKVEFRYVAVNLLRQLGLPSAAPGLRIALEDKSLEVAWLAHQGRPTLGDEDDMHDEDGENSNQEKWDRFSSLERLYLRLPEKPVAIKPLVWPWAPTKADRKSIAHEMVYACREDRPERILPYLSVLDSWRHSSALEALAKQEKWSDETRQTLIFAVGDTAQAVRQTAFQSLAKLSFTDVEIQSFEKCLTRKSSDQRRGVFKLILAQPDNVALASARRLLASKDALQRLGGLEIYRLLAEANRERVVCQREADAYRTARKKSVPLEETQLQAIAHADQEVLTLQNGLGLFDPSQLTPITKPQARTKIFFTEAALACVISLDEFVHLNREKPFKPEHGEEQLLGTVQYSFSFPSEEEKKSREENLARLPYAELWQEWYDTRPASMRDADGLELYRAALWMGHINEDYHWQQLQKIVKGKNARPELQPLMKSVLGKLQPIKVKYEVVEPILGWLIYLNPVPQVDQYKLDWLETTLSLIPDSAHQSLIPDGEEDEENDYRFDYDKPEKDWRKLPVIKLGEYLYQHREHNAAWKQRAYTLFHWMDMPIEGAARMRPEVDYLLAAYEGGQVGIADWYDDVIGLRGTSESRYSRDDFGTLHEYTKPHCEELKKAPFTHHPELIEALHRCRERVLEIELARGDAATPATKVAGKLKSVFGIDVLLRLIKAVGKTGFKANSVWGGVSEGRAQTFTHLISVCYPQSDETNDQFNSKVKAAIQAGDLSEERLLQLLFLAPQWARFVEGYLGWKGLIEGMCWYLAHMSYSWDRTDNAAEAAGFAEEEEGDRKPGDDDEDNRKNSGWARFIRERTPLTDEERREGAIDLAWFQSTYQQLGAKRWEAISQAACYGANSNQARKAEYIGQVLLGQAKRKDLVDGIAKKKLKEFVRLLGLLPLATGNKREGDLLERYKVLQEYHRYAKGLSALSKEGAIRSAEIGLANLARQAGYADPLRMQWRMEAETVRDLAKGSISASKGDITVTLELDERAMPVLSTEKSGKPIKTIPPAIKKDKKIAAITGRVADLKKQSTRIKQSLETAMIRGDSFTGSELQELAEHALLAPQLNRLILIGDGIMGYPDKKGKVLRDHRGKFEPVKKNEQLRLAHPHDLYLSKEWQAWQHDCFTAERLQPFKQVFRELYLLTKQERSDSPQSRRYAGQQIQERQAFALWGSRNWSTQDGVSKTFFDAGITAEVQFNHGITTPLEVEGLTIDSVSFRKRDQWKNMALKDVPARLFSEVMRDMDLVVSVAHRGGVDPEASASTVEMRSSLLKETCQLCN